MTSTNIHDAKKECDSIPGCHMFYDNVGFGDVFYACDNRASITPSSWQSILYQLVLGNKKYMKYKYFRDVLRMGFKPCENMLIQSFRFATVQCPDGYPYAYLNGKRCCRNRYDKNLGGIAFDSTSCYGDEFVACPSAICSSGIYSISYL